VTARAIGLLAVLTLAVIAAPWVAPYDPSTPHRDFSFAPPMPPRIVDGGALRTPFARPVTLVDRLEQRYEVSASEVLPLPWGANADRSRPVFLLGADSSGRDVLSRLFWGARVSIGLALVSTLATVVLGAAVGAWAGYRGGWPDEALMRTADFLLVLPAMYVVLVVRAVLPLVLDSSTVFLLMSGIFALVGWPIVARGVRAIVTVEREREFVLAARSLGAGHARVLRQHLLPSCAGYLVAQATLLLPAFILAEATLSFMGLGFPTDVPTWGTMLTEAANLSSMTRFPWTLAPAAAIFLVTLAANVFVREDGTGASLRVGAGLPSTPLGTGPVRPQAAMPITSGGGSKDPPLQV
jgi:peptide/nickel transport system permease protein